MERNSALKEHYRRFLVDALEICRDELSKGIVLLTEVPPYYMFSSDIRVVSSNQFRQRVGYRINTLQSFKDCIDFLERNPETSGSVNIKVSSPHMSTTYPTSGLVDGLLYDYLHVISTADYYDRVFDILYLQRENYLYSDSIASLH